MHVAQQHLQLLEKFLQLAKLNINFVKAVLYWN